jgi:predicted PurR-regulated permease PerM
MEKLFAGIDSQTISTTLQNSLVDYGQRLSSLAGDMVKIFMAISNGIANAILVLLLTYFMSVDEHIIDKFILQVFPSKYGRYITQKTTAIKGKIGEWLRGQIMLMIAVGLVTYLGLLILGVEYAATLGVFAGLTELIPVIGPLIALVGAIPIAANQSGLMILWVTILYFIIQRLENNLLVPLIMKKATGLHPIIVLFAMLVGYRFMGIIGIVISIPVAAALGIFLHDHLRRSEK